MYLNEVNVFLNQKYLLSDVSNIYNSPEPIYVVTMINQKKILRKTSRIIALHCYSELEQAGSQMQVLSHTTNNY